MEGNVRTRLRRNVIVHRDILIMIAAIISLALYYLHLRIYRKARRFRGKWAAITVGIGIGYIFYRLPEWIYGLSVEGFTALWTGIVICGIGVVMFILREIF